MYKTAANHEEIKLNTVVGKSEYEWNTGNS